MWPTTIKAKAGLVATIAGAIAGILTMVNQAQVAEPMWLATRSFVRTQVTEQQNYLKAQLAPIEMRQIQQEVAQLRSARDSTRDKIFDLDLLSKKEVADPDMMRNIQKQRQELQDRIEAITSRLQQLQKEVGR